MSNDSIQINEHLKADERLKKVLSDTVDHSHTPADHMRAALIYSLSEGKDDERYTIRAILKRAGYGFSTFYKNWRSMPDFLLSSYKFGSNSFLRGLALQIDNFRGETPVQFFEMLAWYSLAMNMKLPRHLVSSIILTHLEGRFSRVMTHVPSQVDLICDGFNRNFVEHGLRMDREKCNGVVNVLAVYFYATRIDQDLAQNQSELVSLMVELMSTCVIDDLR